MTSLDTPLCYDKKTGFVNSLNSLTNNGLDMVGRLPLPLKWILFVMRGDAITVLPFCFFRVIEQFPIHGLASSWVPEDLTRVSSANLTSTAASSYALFIATL